MQICKVIPCSQFMIIMLEQTSH